MKSATPKAGHAKRTRKPAKPTPAGARIGDLPMGHGGARHPALGLGLWGLGRWFADDEKRTRDVVVHAFERQLPWIDTAEVYGAGRSERILGDQLARWPNDRPRPFITTKLSWEHLRASQVRASLIGSRQRLGVPRIDLYLVHAPDPRVPLRQTMPALEAVWKEGLIGAIGVSNFSVEQLEAAQEALSEAEIVANQVQFNLLEREEADPVLDYCAKHKIVVEAYSPVARGLLAGRYLTGKGPAKGDPRHDRGLFEKERFPESQRRAKAIAAVAEEEGVPMLALSLHGLRRAGAAPVFGASDPAQVDAALEAWAARPSDAAVDRAVRIARGDAD